MLELKLPENSKLLYGEDIRDQLPEITNINFDYDDILARRLYHLDKSLSEKESLNAMKEFSKAIFKTTFYICIFLNPTYLNTRIMENGKQLKQLITQNGEISKINEFFEEALIFRITGQYKSDFKDLRNNFILFIFNLLKNGDLHKKMDYQEMVKYLTENFGGFPYLIQQCRKLNF